MSSRKIGNIASIASVAELLENTACILSEQVCINSCDLEIGLAIFEPVEAVVDLLLYRIEVLVDLLLHRVHLLSQTLDGGEDILLVLKRRDIGNELGLNAERVKGSGDDSGLGKGSH